MYFGEKVIESADYKVLIQETNLSYFAWSTLSYQAKKESTTWPNKVPLCVGATLVNKKTTGTCSISVLKMLRQVKQCWHVSSPMMEISQTWAHSSWSFHAPLCQHPGHWSWTDLGKSKVEENYILFQHENRAGDGHFHQNYRRQLILCLI